VGSNWASVLTKVAGAFQGFRWGEKFEKKHKK
jgi:hypothetical protein